MYRFKEFLKEDVETKELDDKLKEFGYSKPFRGAHGHVSYINRSDPDEMILVDFPGKEWHFMSRIDHHAPYVVRKIDSTSNDSLEKYLKS